MMVRSPMMPASEFGHPKAVNLKRILPTADKPKSRIRTAIKSMHIPAWKVMLYTVLAGLFGAVYLQHVFTTQAILREVNLLHRDLDRATIRHNELRFTYERMTGPADVYLRSKDIGLMDGGPADHIITLR